jgi:hypothetical protein
MLVEQRNEALADGAGRAENGNGDLGLRHDDLLICASVVE